MLLGERGAPSVEEIADARLVELAVGRSANVRQRAAVPRARSEAGDGQPYRSTGGDGRGPSTACLSAKFPAARREEYIPEKSISRTEMLSMT